MAKHTGRLLLWNNFCADGFDGDVIDAAMRSPRLSFCIDLRVDSVPRNSFIIVEPKY